MFRGGGKVSSYGNGIATGLADGGRVNLKLGGPPLFDPAVTGSPAAYPTAESVAKMYTYKAIPRKIQKARTRAWTKFKSGQ